MLGVIGVLTASAVFAVLFAYICTTFLLSQFNVHQRMLVGERSLLIIFAANIIGLILLWIVGLSLLTATGRDLQLPAALIAVGAQAIWLIRHLWLYRRDHLRVHYESYEN